MEGRPGLEGGSAGRSRGVKGCAQCMLSCRQTQCIARAHRAWFTLTDERVCGPDVLFSVDEHRRTAPSQLVRLRVCSGELECTCGKAGVWCEHCCYVLLYELDIGASSVSEEMIRARQLPNDFRMRVANWVQFQLGRQVLFMPEWWEDKEGDGRRPLVFNSGGGSTPLACEAMQWPRRPASAAGYDMCIGDPQKRVVQQAGRHFGRESFAAYDLMNGRLSYSVRELRRRAAFVVVDLSTGKLACDCFQSKIAPALWCKHRCSLIVTFTGLSMVRDMDAVGTLARRRLDPATALGLFGMFGGPQQEGCLVMRGTSLRSRECPICLSEVEQDDDPDADCRMCSRCCIGYHGRCIRSWLGGTGGSSDHVDRVPSCPTCRRVMRGFP